MNSLLNIPIVNRPPTRLVASGTITINAGASATFPGLSARQDRLQIVITNLDVASSVKVQTMAGTNFATIFPQRNITIETNADIQINNPSGAPVQVEVCELYIDLGNQIYGSGGVPAKAVGGSGGGAPAVGGSGGGSRGGGGHFTP
jgi:uncharacterized membrane protein YgcG